MSNPMFKDDLPLVCACQSCMLKPLKPSVRYRQGSDGTPPGPGETTPQSSPGHQASSPNMNEEGFAEGPLLQDLSQSSSYYPDMSLTMLSGMKPQDYTSFDYPLLQQYTQYTFQDYLQWPSGTFLQQQQVYAQHPPLDEMFETVDMAATPEAPTLFNMDPTGPEIMRMCLQDTPDSDGYSASATTSASSSETDPMMEARDLTTDAEMCMTCFGVFPSRATLARHVRLAHMRVPRVWNVCDVCGKALATPRSLRMHKLRHTGVKSCCCPSCGAAFYEPGQLRAHQRAKHPQPAVKDLPKDAALDLGLRVVHQQGGADQGGGGVVFTRAEAGDVEGIVATPRVAAASASAAAPTTTAQVDGEERAQEEDDGIVIRLVRCKEQEGAWKVEHVSKIF
ncbi:PR domain zinc finger protein 5 [Frankliniella fusca]|uniref:PR domain zinc finger protein 5 n=1 Tax=Frankliniella fusca TaxID=407009 RepID=A0AAE1HJ97_9NEOP|nr:PR domain zinc finger protein 5 [Frankliniella fusca]